MGSQGRYRNLEEIGWKSIYGDFVTECGKVTDGRKSGERGR